MSLSGHSPTGNHLRWESSETRIQFKNCSTGNLATSNRPDYTRRERNNPTPFSYNAVQPRPDDVCEINCYDLMQPCLLSNFLGRRVVSHTSPSINNRSDAIRRKIPSGWLSGRRYPMERRIPQPVADTGYCKSEDIWNSPILLDVSFGYRLA